jgi:hypothetical protein
VRRPIDRLFQGVVILMGFALGAQPIGDNSMFVHLRTGVDIVNGLGIPRRDPYSFTAHGTRWVVQSWLPSTLYGVARSVGGDGLLLLLQGTLTATLAYLVFRLAGRAGSTLRTAGAAVAAIAIGGPFWSPRPLLFGLLCLALTIVVVVEERAPWLLVPVAWVWVSSHGSFPLGGLWLVLVAVGAAIDQRRLWTEQAKRLAWFVGGLVVACINPLGPRLLLFPLVLGDHADTFRDITEWRSPDFQHPLGLVSLVGLVATVGVLARRRLPWAGVLPVACFLGLGLLALRNLAPLSLVAAAGLGAALAEDAVEATDAPTERARWTRADRLVTAVALAAAVFVGVDAASSPALDLSTYPRQVVVDGERQGVLAVGRRVATQDVVGCYLILRRGRAAGVFVDDRYDMYPVQVAADYVTLLHATPGAADVLSRHAIDTVLWGRSQPLVPLLVAAGWQEQLGDKRWVVLTRPGTWPVTTR